MSSSAEQIKERLSVTDVIGSYIKVEKAGANFKARCPFHHEKTPSFFISPNRGSYYCFGCGMKGDIFSFVQEFEKVDFMGALKILAEKAGVEISQYDTKQKGEFDRMRSVMEEATKFFSKNFVANSSVQAYIKSRGLTEQTIKDWRIGFAKEDWRTLFEHLVAKRIDVNEIERVGLIKKGENSGYYDRFRSRIIFPLFDASGRVIAYSGRLFESENAKKNKQAGDAEAPKYLNSPDTPLFNKSETLYGYHKAKDGIRKWGYAVLVEGQMDLLMSHQNGFTNTIATSGTSLTRQHLEKIKKMTDNLMIVYDADNAGLKATLRAWTSALALGMDVKIAALPAGEDPASLLLKNKELFKEALQKSKHIIDYYLDIVIKEGLTERALWKQVETEVLPYVAAIDSSIDRAHFVSKINLKTGLSESSINDQLAKTKPIDFSDENKSSENDKVEPDLLAISSASSLKDKAVERLVGLMLWKKEKNEDDEMVSGIKSEIIRITSQNYFDKVFEQISERKDELIFQAEILYEGSKDIKEQINELLDNLEEDHLKSELAKSMGLLSQAEKKNEKNEALRLVNICKDISLKLSDLNNKRRNKK